MTPLRQRMIHELELHRKSRHTIEAYVTAVAQLARHYGRSPEAISVEEIRDFLHHLITVQKAAFSTCNLKLAGIQFFYHHVLGQEQFSLRVPAKRSGRLPEPLSRNEIAKLFEVTSNLKHRTLLMTVYGGGLRVSEVVHLRPRDIHSDRMLIRVNQGKGARIATPCSRPGCWRNSEPIGVSTDHNRSGCSRVGMATGRCRCAPPGRREPRRQRSCYPETGVLSAI